jgi:hypothetical protein
MVFLYEGNYKYLVGGEDEEIEMKLQARHMGYSLWFCFSEQY